jgi:phosphoglycerate kinase
MRPVADALAERLSVPVLLAPDCVGAEVERMAEALPGGTILLLENLRFHAGEKANDPKFAMALSRLGELYVNDAFGVSHRAHASVAGVTEHITAVAGDLLQREVGMLSRVLVQPASPFLLVLGGAKVADKVGVIANLLPLVDQIAIGGAMANAFLAATGRQIGNSLAPDGAIEQARGLLRDAKAAGVEVLLPKDLVCAPGIDRPDAARVVYEVAADEMALDIGPESRRAFVSVIAQAQTVVWNGPMGVFETPEFGEGTRAIAEAIADLPDAAFSVVGGGDTAAAAAVAGITDRVSHVSTGGGASLDLLSGQILPGVASLTDKEVPS